MRKDETRLFSALLRHWRTRRGMSQLDLAIAADVSSRHVSFLETGRAQPGREMVLVLAAALDVPLRDQNVLLDSAGFPPAFDEPPLDGGMAPAIGQAIDRMLAHHEPFPMAVMTRTYDLLRANAAATRMLGAMVLDPSSLGDKPNLMRALFDPRAARSFVVDWERTARSLLSRLHRESLARPSDEPLASLVAALVEYPDVPEAFRQPDFAAPSEPTFTLRMRRDDLRLAFLTTVTAFNAPQNVTLEELRIESYFPLDDATAAACEAMAHEVPPQAGRPPEGHNRTKAP
jgi:transcriptional regulator with XRE-family HTH domain